MTDHITEEETVRLADGQLVPRAVAGHAEACESCAQRVADQALLSLTVQHDLAALVASAALDHQPSGRAHARRAVVREPASPSMPQLPSSKVPLAVGLLVAIAASIPALPGVARELTWLSASRHFSLDAVRQVMGALREVASGPLLSLAATVGMVALGVLVASRATRLERDSHEPEGAIE